MSSYLVPSVIEQTRYGERAVDIYSRLLSERIVYVGTPIDDGVANAVVAQLLHLESDRPEADINLYLNSPGGDPTAMLGIYDTMQFIRAPVTTTCVGQAAGTAAVLLAGGAPGRRSILPHARVVLSQPGQGGTSGDLPDLQVAAKEIARVRDELDALLARHTGRPATQVRVDTERDRVLGAAEAIDYGVVDVVLDSRKLLGALWAG